MQKIFLTLFAVLVIGGLVGGGYLYFQQPAVAAVDPAAKTGKHAAQKNSKGRGAETAEYVELDPLVLPILDKNGVSQILSLVVVIEVGDEETAKNVEYLAPRLKDAYIQKMYGVLSRKTVLVDGVLRVDVVKKLLNEISDDVLGDDVAQDVLLKVVQQRPL